MLVGGSSDFKKRQKQMEVTTIYDDSRMCTIITQRRHTNHANVTMIYVK